MENQGTHPVEVKSKEELLLPPALDPKGHEDESYEVRKAFLAARRQLVDPLRVGKFGAEFRRFSLEPSELERFCDFYGLLQHVHRIPDVDVLVGYADNRGGVLPISNDDNYRKAMSSARPLLRIFLHRKDDADPNVFFGDAPQGTKRLLGAVLRRARREPPMVIGPPQDFRPVAAVLDADVLPAWLRRVRLHRRGSDRPLGFYIRDGTAEVMTAGGVRKVPGVFISRVVPDGLAHSSGLLSANDQVFEVNGVPVAGRSLDQVTDMMVANSHNLIVTVRPADQRHNAVGPWPGAGPHPPFGVEQNFLFEEEEESEEEDLVTEAGREPRPVPRYELHLGLRPAGSGSVGSRSTVDSGWGVVAAGPDLEEEPEEESSSGEEGVAVTL